MHHFSIVITSIAGSENKILNQIGKECKSKNIPFILIGDKKSPEIVEIEGSKYFNLNKQKELGFKLSESLPENSYCRKNLGYLEAIKNGANIIVETDDDNIPLQNFWNERSLVVEVKGISQKGWVNIYNFFSSKFIWPRGFPLQHIHDPKPETIHFHHAICPIQQGLADREPDVDAVYRMIFNETLYFEACESIAISYPAVCPFNSQNTTWFKPAFPLMYLPVTCSFRMTDIWRSFIAQRILATCGWFTLFSQSTVEQFRNQHNLLHDFNEETDGYKNYSIVIDELTKLSLAEGPENIPSNLKICYKKLIDTGIFKPLELEFVNLWLVDLESLKINLQW